MKPKLTYIISKIDRWAQFEWIAESLRERNFETQFIILNHKPGYFEDFLFREKYKVHSIKFINKKDIPRAIIETITHLRDWNTDVIHCHFFDATLVGLTAARFLGVSSRIHTRHHANEHHKNSYRGVWLDRYNNSLSTKIIAISNSVKDILVNQEAVFSDKVQVVHHGFNLDQFVNADHEKINILKNKYSLASRGPVIGLVSRFVDWKGIQYAIDAFCEILKSYPNSVLFLANARGNYKNELLAQLKKIPKENYRMSEFENDIFSLLHCFDIFIHVPIDNVVEAFGQVYVEACAAGKPCVFTRSGIANDFFEDGKNCLIVPHQNSVAISQAVVRLLEDKWLAKNISENAQRLVLNQFNLENMMEQFEKLYISS